MEDANDKLKGALEAAAKKDRDKVRSVNEDMLGRHSRVMSLISDLQRNVTASINKLEGHQKHIEHTAEQLVVYQDETRLLVDKVEENKRKLEEKIEKQLQKLFKATDPAEILKPFGAPVPAGK